MSSEKSYWIKERANPQLGTYYVPCGQLSKTSARAKENSLYGYNIMHEFPSAEAYVDELTKIRKLGKRVH